MVLHYPIYLLHEKNINGKYHKQKSPTGYVGLSWEIQSLSRWSREFEPVTLPIINRDALNDMNE